MVHIRKNSNNRVGFSLRELSILTDPEVYRFEFTSENSKDVKVIIDDKVPFSSTNRLQIFVITEGEFDVTFPHEGYYSYEVYQKEQNNLVEVGLLRVIGEDEEIQEHISTTTHQVYVRS